MLQRVTVRSSSDPRRVLPGMMPKPEAARARVKLPTLHPAQARLFRLKGKRKAGRCGRRWGKNVLGESIAVSDALKGRLVGWFAPENKRLKESYEVIADNLESVKRRTNKTDGMIETITRGKVEFWSLEDENAGRSRKYHRIIVDEAAFTKPKAIDIWLKSIEPTLLDYDGSALFLSNTNGIDPENLMWQVCNEKKHGFVDFHAPTTSNPLLPLRKPFETAQEWMIRREAYFRDLMEKTPPLVYDQEYGAKFVDWSGAAFFTRDSLLDNGQPVELPARCEAVFAIVDTATKTGKDRDGTGVVYYALIRNYVRPVNPDGTMGPAYRLIILDWDITQIEGDLLEVWLPNVFQRLQDFAADCGALRGSLGALVEDKNSGSVLLMKMQRMGKPAHPIDSKLTAMGKDERALSCSGYIHQGLVKLARPAYEKVTMYKETTRNHLLGQVVGFRIGDKNATREDDLADCFMYGAIVTFGTEDGF